MVSVAKRFVTFSSLQSFEMPMTSVDGMVCMAGILLFMTVETFLIDKMYEKQR